MVLENTGNIRDFYISKF